MLRRLRILAADAFFLVALCLLMFSVFSLVRRSQDVNTVSNDPVPLAFLAAGPTSLEAEPGGEDAAYIKSALQSLATEAGQGLVTVWVAIDPEGELILPGDDVVLGASDQSGSAIGPLMVSAIERPRRRGETQVMMTLTGASDDIDAVRGARETTLLTAKSHRIKLEAVPRGFPALHEDQVTVMRFADGRWQKRFPARPDQR